MHDSERQIGKTILIGITRVDANGSEEHEQFAGTITRFEANAPAVAVIACSDGLERSFPWDSLSLSPAPPGEYRLRSDGSVITDPDWLMQWTVHQEN